MRVLLIKTSSMGDLIHTLPALTDAMQAIPEIKFDWVVEESFAQIPRWHAAVQEVIPLAFRRWRKNFLSRDVYREWSHLHTQLNQQPYDLVLDAQGLIKSAFFSLFTRGKRAGLDFSSAREGLAALAYQEKHNVNFYQHAITRMRSLFSQALAYDLPNTPPDFNLHASQFPTANPQEKYLVFLHGTTWSSKQWPETYWLQLGELAAANGYRIKMSGGSEEEVARAARLAQALPMIDFAPRLDLASMAKWLAHAQAVVAVDTGFGHLAAALGVPTISLYGSTNPAYTGAIGPASLLLSAKFPCAPCLNRNCSYKKPSAVTPACYETLPPAKVWEAILQQIQNSQSRINTV